MNHMLLMEVVTTRWTYTAKFGAVEVIKLVIEELTIANVLPESVRMVVA